MTDFTLKAPTGANKKRKRVGRGSSSGLGSTAGRGNKGQQSRSGKTGPYVGFEGGQMPLYRQVARRGFSNYRFKKEFAIVNLRDIEARFQEGDVVNRASLKEKRLIGKVKDGVKILADGELSKKLSVEAEKISGAAREKIEKAGGSVTVIPEKNAKAN